MGDATIFLHRAFEHLSEAVHNIFHPSYYEHTLREIGLTLGREVVNHLRRSHTIGPPFQQEDYVCCLTWLRTHWGWDHDVTAATKGLICISVPRDPLGELAEHDRPICQIEAAMLGGIAGDLLNYGKVEMCRETGIHPRSCTLIVHLERSARSLILEGPTFPLSYPRTEPPQPADLNTPAFNHLSLREQEILRLIGEGLSDKEIANALHLSVRTVEGHAARIRAKTKLGTRSALIRLALLTQTAS